MDMLVCERMDGRAIGPDNVSEIVPFAQSEMAKGFMYGVPPGLLYQIQTGFVKATDDIEDELRKTGRLSAGDNIDQIKEAARLGFSTGLVGNLLGAHTIPMKRVVGLLPVDELADLAEILVRMESIKERVTRDTEEVGGPIDVAVITKGDGFIWIKRKHYFDPKLNPRFFSRRGMAYHE